ncbi:MAG: insulinase family protein [Levilactobacillus sp.]|jgi:predicted Zn-dependent peptidase|uniref:Insulinase family protein n=1 Tax=Levilactobacillus suantsaiihabitans TaxID=2487722 RepID=A0A4Z0JAX7_9LACO|nr:MULTISPECIES: pitrilysin family protein [Levilactobacillus]MCH4124291.1 insulinase family protein [Levilactobacillus sp.]MCI1554276.1 insulinase family protein [Levilactobacillus sp.]MCI1599873.1 insulinase family protein [Levilactobacillus sp.]MCI1606654.1 insulinase family protein [Levilactobacillus sp.]TGD19252.1 insulinase family protein [Levilactobacillus suantsaiihabitans]
MLNKQTYSRLGETVFQTTLANGLKVILVPKAGFHKTFAVMTTNYGSTDNEFVPRGQSEAVRFPDGIAHFLEHKLFEKKDHDAFDLFGQYGASANAFTSFTQTSYLFATTSHLHENLDILLDFVQDPYFTAATVNKEKGIIGQEIEMYDDDPGWQSYFGMIGQLYPREPLHIDIAGTVDSIDKITADDLYAAYNTFYHPSNMNLIVVGQLDPEETLAWISANQDGKTFGPSQPIQRVASPQTPAAEIVPTTTRHLTVNRPKVSIGLRGYDDVPAGQAGLTYNVAVSLAFDLLFNDTSDNYLRLYDANVIDDSFGYDFQIQRGAHFAQLAGDTDHPESFVSELTAILTDAPAQLLAAKAQFDLVKREAIGRTIGAINSVEAIANQYDGPLFDGATIFDELTVLEGMTFETVQAALAQFQAASRQTVYTILP